MPLEIHLTLTKIRFHDLDWDLPRNNAFRIQPCISFRDGYLHLGCPLFLSGIKSVLHDGCRPALTRSSIRLRKVIIVRKNYCQRIRILCKEAIVWNNLISIQYFDQVLNDSRMRSWGISSRLQEIINQKFLWCCHSSRNGPTVIKSEGPSNNTISFNCTTHHKRRRASHITLNAVRN